DSLEALKALTARSPEDVIASGLHEYVDEVQLALLDLGAKVASTFF
ncbi:MAG: alpha-E domain-containing protein, partial [Deltaproteobacteria bacterium]|nr:alpha-E domain-containing protein [Deltaproteobacteria bacterium]